MLDNCLACYYLTINNVIKNIEKEGFEVWWLWNEEK